MKSSRFSGRGQNLPYLDIPSSTFAKVLKAMKRPANADNVRNASCKRWREICPELVIRSLHRWLWPGFGETEEIQYPAGLPARSRAGPGRLFHLFAGDGAAANALPDPVPEDVKEDRKAR